MACDLNWKYKRPTTKIWNRNNTTGKENSCLEKHVLKSMNGLFDIATCIFFFCLNAFVKILYNTLSKNMHSEFSTLRILYTPHSTELDRSFNSHSFCDDCQNLT